MCASFGRLYFFFCPLGHFHKIVGSPEAKKRLLSTYLTIHPAIEAVSEPNRAMPMFSCNVNKNSITFRCELVWHAPFLWPFQIGYWISWAGNRQRERGRERGRRTKISGINFVVYFRALSGISQFVWHLNRSSLQLNSTNKSASSCVCRKFQMLELLRAHSLAPPLPRSLCVFYLRSLSAEIWNPNRAT